MDEVGQPVFVIRKLPNTTNELGKESVGGVDDHVQAEVEGLGENEVFSKETGDSILVNGSRSNSSRFSGIGNLFIGSGGSRTKSVKGVGDFILTL